MNYKNICYFAVTGLLGFKRGSHSYNYNLEKDNIKYKKNDNFFYSNYILYGLFGSTLYMNPLTLFFLIPKETYRLEVNLRSLEDEKKTDYYNELIF